MALLIRFPLRLWLPLVIFLSLAGTLAVSVWSTQHYRHRHLYREARQDISAQALHLASEAEHMMRTTPRLMAHKPSQLYTDPQVAVVAVLDPDGRVLFAHRKEWQGLFLTALLSHFDANRLEKTVAGALPNVVERRDRARLSILHPYPFPASEGQLRSLKQGAVYLEYDLSPAVANIGVQVLTESAPIAAAILLVSIALAWILHQQITRPLESLRQATRELGRGNINTPIRMTGAAEFTELAQSFQGMANELENAMRNLISSREHLATMLHSIGDALIATDLEGRITLMNPIAETLTGWSFAEAKGQSVDRIFRIENTQTGCPAPIPVEQVIRTGKAMGLANHIGLIARDGKRYHIADSAAPIRDDRGQLTGVVMVFRDVTEAYRLREALAESELHYRTLADSGQALIWASSPDKRCTYFNHSWLAFTGRRLEEELGDGWTQGVHPDDLADCLATYEQAFDRREPFSLVYRLRRHDGTYRWIIDEAQPRYDSKGRFLGYIGHCLDITDLRQAQTEIEHRSAELEAILAALPDLFFLLDGEGRFLDFRAQNPSDLYLPPENFMGRRVSEVMPPQVSRDFQKALDKLRCSKQTVTQELELPFPQGKRWFEAHINQVANSDELVVLVRDISSRKNAEKEIHRLAYYDALTGLPNRHLLMEYLHHSLAGAQRSGHIGALLFIDLDQFKRVNDARGHQVGDRVLKQVGARLTRFLREGDMVARLGGDEFVVLLTDLADEREAAAHLARSIAQKVRITLQPPFNVDGVDYHIGASIGITVFSQGE
ncbi:MAG: PAS domain S-box protein [Methylohalobius sp. ZOD2]|nr:PAS domain S-box protein [Methylothermaceae bacterium]